MKELLKKLAEAKKSIKQTKMKKEGINKFSNYTYFTPSQIEELVYQACVDNNLLTKFDLVRNELGIYGKLTIYDVLTGESIEYVMSTDIPEIKATNIAQQLGGTVTYTERYLKTTAFGIVDNSLDFDTTENTKKAAEEKPKKDVARAEPKSEANITKIVMEDKYFNTYYKRMETGEPNLFQRIKDTFILTKTQLEAFEKLNTEIETELNFKK